jgi:cytochrome c556
MAAKSRSVNRAFGMLAALGAVALAASVAGAADNPIEARKALMQANSAAVKVGSAMVKGEKPFDAAEAEHVMRTINAVAIGVVNFFPPDSKTGDTRASPKIWEDLKGFVHQAHELEEHSEEGIAAAKKGLDAFKTAFAETTKYCGSCHETYRLKKQ